MHYKTIVLGLLEQRPAFQEQLRKEHLLLRTLDQYALDLKSLHESQKQQLMQTKAEDDPSQIASEALELAIRDLENRLPRESPEAEDEFLSLDGAMTFLRRHSPNE